MNIFIETMRALSFAIVRPPYIFVLIVVAFVFYKRNLKVMLTQKMVIGKYQRSALELTISQVVFGILGGAFASLILTALGVTFSVESHIELLLVISFLLTFIKPRFICFSYSGAIFGLISIILKFMGISVLDIYIPSLIAIVAVLHVIEGILVIIDGSSGAVPVFTYRENEILGGFILKRHWAMPVALIFFQSSGNMMFINDMPRNFLNYSGILKPENGILMSALLGFGLFYGAIGYNAVTFTRGKKEKAVSSGIFVFLYGSVMLVLSIISKINLALQIAIIIIMPLLHEGMILYQSLKEVNGKPKFVSDKDGIVVLDVHRNSLACKNGVKSGYKIIEVNNIAVESEKQIYKEIENMNVMCKLRIKVKDILGEIKTIDFNTKVTKQDIGIVFVPRKVKEDKIVNLDNSSFKEILSTIIKRK